ncbi:WzyE family oligosaccharide polymerase [Shewanella xiamenensis]|uniref:WzyE family oligosaccharide polymerase n=1 Tax=Shewanella xiamenensis TaxID=332186 RepID=UPI00222E5B16|nr:WzyE family oligosaccharide polymerase [Shewanella xiamenensis]
MKTWLGVSNTHYTFFSFSLIFLGLFSLIVFVSANGFLFFKLNDYDEIFSSGIAYSWIRKFFYFFFVGMVALYFKFRTKSFLYLFFFVCLIFGVLSYFAVGGSRANLLLAVIFFIIIGIKDKHIKFSRIVIFLPFAFLLMSFLAIIRYNYIPEGTTLMINLLSLTKGTFSPWENVAAIFERYEVIDFQYFWPVIRDFYQYIPKSLWLEDTDVIMNTGNYLTFVVLQNADGLTFSPTLIGSLLIMGGWFGVFCGSLILSYISWFFELLYFNSNIKRFCYRLDNFSKVCLCYCVSLIFFQISLVRDGVDTFISRVIFFTGWFVALFVLTYIFLFLIQPKRKLM